MRLVAFQLIDLHNEGLFLELFYLDLSTQRNDLLGLSPAAADCTLSVLVALPSLLVCICSVLVLESPTFVGDVLVQVLLLFCRKL